MRIHFLCAYAIHLKIADDITLMDTWIPPEEVCQEAMEDKKRFA